jgi:ribosomal protein L21
LQFGFFFWGEGSHLYSQRIKRELFQEVDMGAAVQTGQVLFRSEEDEVFHGKPFLKAAKLSSYFSQVSLCIKVVVWIS